MINLKLRDTIIRDLQEIEKLVKSLPQLRGQLKLDYTYSGVSIEEWDSTVSSLPFKKWDCYVYLNETVSVLIFNNQLS